MAQGTEVEAAIAAKDAVALARAASSEELDKLKLAEDVIRLAAERTRSSFTLATVSQLIVGIVALGGMLVNIYQSRVNKASQAEQGQADQARWNKEFQRAQRADKYRAFFETSVLATDPTNPDKRLVGYALLQEFVEDDEYNSKATLMLEESLMQELRGDVKTELDDAHRNAVVAIVTALSQSNDCHALERAARSIARIAQRHVANGGDGDDTTEIFAIYVRRLVGRASIACKSMKELAMVRRPLADALMRLPEIGGAKGKLKEPDAFGRIAQVLIDRCSDEVAITGPGECGQAFEKYSALCNDVKPPDGKDEQAACALVKGATPAMTKPSPLSPAPAEPE
jgi:hypothetical protein